MPLPCQQLAATPQVICRGGPAMLYVSPQHIDHALVKCHTQILRGSVEPLSFHDQNFECTQPVFIEGLHLLSCSRQHQPGSSQAAQSCQPLTITEKPKYSKVYQNILAMLLVLIDHHSNPGLVAVQNILVRGDGEWQCSQMINIITTAEARLHDSVVFCGRA
jgi:hypothetical protein